MLFKTYHLCALTDLWTPPCKWTTCRQLPESENWLHCRQLCSLLLPLNEVGELLSDHHLDARVNCGSCERNFSHSCNRVWQAYYAHTHTHEIIEECWLCWEWNPRMRPRISQADKLFEKLTSPDEHTLPPPTKFMSGKL